MFKSYGNRKNALAAAKRASTAPELVVEIDGKWGFEVAELLTEETSTEAAPEVVVQETTPTEHATPVVATDVTESGRKIEKDRPKQNGVTRPSAGGMCRNVWDFCDVLQNGATELQVTVAQVKAHAEASSWNANNASIEYYQWRKYHGFRGRQQVAVAAPEAPTA